MKIFAHRGYAAKYPENTLVSFKAAKKLPIEGIELDVHLTKDREIVVIHDESINRTSNGKGYVKDMTLKELRQFDYGSWFHKEFSGEKIPTLEEVLELFQHTHHKINIELKSDKFVYAELEELVLQAVENFHLKKRIIISSFDHEAIKRVMKLAPDVECAPLFSHSILNMAEYCSAIPVKAFHVSYKSAIRRPVLDAIQGNIKVRVYGVNQKEQVEVLRHIGVDGVITDRPKELSDMLKG